MTSPSSELTELTVLTPQRVRYMRAAAIEHSDAGYRNAENDAIIALCDYWLAGQPLLNMPECACVDFCRRGTLMKEHPDKEFWCRVLAPIPREGEPTSPPQQQRTGDV